MPPQIVDGDRRGLPSFPRRAMSNPKYSIVSELGSGGMGKIYKGLLVGHSDFQRPIVIKQLRHGEDESHVRMFVEEARRYAVLDHENIGRIFDFEKVGD